jgi:hypothetical protein
VDSFVVANKHVVANKCEVAVDVMGEIGSWVEVTVKE